MKRRRLTPLYGIGVFVFVILTMFFVYAPLQGRFGMYGLAMTEAGLLITAVAAALLFGQDLKEVFPVKMPGLKPVFGTVLLWFGSYLLVLIGTLFMAFLFPEEILGINQSMGSVLYSVPALLTFTIAAVMPAICEESLHRGLIQFTFGRESKKWVIVLSMGIIFGIFHLNPYRFLPTALLGGALTFLMIETKNILYPMLFHLINNSPAAFLSGISADVPQTGETVQGVSLTAIPLASIGVYMIIGVAAPFLIFFGWLLFRDKAAYEARPDGGRKAKGRALLAAAIFAILLLVGGILVFGYGIAYDPATQELLKGALKSSGY